MVTRCLPLDAIGLIPDAVGTLTGPTAGMVMPPRTAGRDTNDQQNAGKQEQEKAFHDNQPPHFN